MVDKVCEAEGIVLPSADEGFRIVEKSEAIYVFGIVPMSWMNIVHKMAKKRGFSLFDIGVGAVLGCWVFTNEENSQHLRNVIEQRSRREHGDDKLRVWLDGCDTGVSSRTIAHVLGGVPIHVNSNYPYDPDDFGRCLRLVRLMGWRDRLHEVSERYPNTAWPGIIDAWDEIAALYDEEAPSGRAPKCYALMLRLRREAL